MRRAANIPLLLIFADEPRSEIGGLAHAWSFLARRKRRPGVSSAGVGDRRSAKNRAVAGSSRAAFLSYVWHTGAGASRGAHWLDWYSRQCEEQESRCGLPGTLEEEHSLGN